jgi:NAD(P)-dependent dehydrogenase (short-subunit alcohol dehydrogenase family)
MNKVVLITGASSGLGEALATCMSRKGYRVYGTSRKGEQVSNNYHMLTMDVQQDASVKTAIEKLIQAEGRIDLVINNAGIGIAAPFEEVSMDKVLQVFQTNVFGMMRVCQAVLPTMRAQGTGRILNISSIGSQIGLPFRSVYSASKACVDIMTEAMRMEISGFGIDTAAILAGDMQTPINSNRLHEDLAVTSPYREMFHKVHALINADVDKGKKPSEVADLIVEIAQQRSIKRSYVIGKPLQKTAILAKRLLPGWLFERIIMKYSGM